MGDHGGAPPPHNSLKTAVVTGGIAVLVLGGFLAYRGASSQNVPAPATSERAPAIASPSPLPAVTTRRQPVATSRTNRVLICGFQADPAAGEPRSPRHASRPSPCSAGRARDGRQCSGCAPSARAPFARTTSRDSPAERRAPPPSIPGVSDEKFCRCVGRRAGGGRCRAEPLCLIRFRRGCRALQARASGSANEGLRHGVPQVRGEPSARACGGHPD